MWQVIVVNYTSQKWHHAIKSFKYSLEIIDHFDLLPGLLRDVDVPLLPSQALLSTHSKTLILLPKWVKIFSLFSSRWLRFKVHESTIDGSIQLVHNRIVNVYDTILSDQDVVLRYRWNIGLCLRILWGIPNRLDNRNMATKIRSIHSGSTFHLCCRKYNSIRSDGSISSQTRSWKGHWLVANRAINDSHSVLDHRNI